MFKIDYANNIMLTRGDSAYIEIELTDEDDYKYALEQGDSLILTVKQNPRCTTPILQKRFDDTDVRIAPKDTHKIYFKIHLASHFKSPAQTSYHHKSNGELW